MILHIKELLVINRTLLHYSSASSLSHVVVDDYKSHVITLIQQAQYTLNYHYQLCVLIGWQKDIKLYYFTVV